MMTGDRPDGNINKPTMQVFISSKTTEMRAYRDKAIAAIHALGMRHKNYNDNGGVGFSQGYKTIFALNRDTIHQCDVFIGLYGFGGVWRPASQMGLQEHHPELRDDPDKLILEYEYEWAKQAGLYVFRFVCTERTTDVPVTTPDARMLRFRDRLMSEPVGWLTTPDSFYAHLLGGLRGISPRVFLSYSRRNTDRAIHLQKQLREEDIHAWRDVTNIPGGADWFQAIQTALAEMEALVVVVTAESMSSEWVKKECETFLAQRKTVIPFIADPTVQHEIPDYLSSLQFVDGTTATGLQDLIKRLRSVL